MSRPTTTPPDPDSRAAPVLRRLADRIVSCEKCPRLRAFCVETARVKRAAFRHETYWAKPVPGGGDPHARIVIVGLAPAAHGANRTGRNFTGDGKGGSGDFLMAALYANGLANQDFSRDRSDGLVLTDVWVTAAVRCAPPDNKPSPAEIANCEEYLRAEVAALDRATVYVALGRIAFEACWRILAERFGSSRQPRPRFTHGAVHRFRTGQWLMASYHPSRQNTQTGRLTAAMLRRVFRDARAGATSSASDGRRASPARKRPRPLP